MNSDSFFHYPPDLFDLIVQTIPLLNRSKQSVLIFFKGAGVSENIFSDISEQLQRNRSSMNKYEISRTILERINKDSDQFLRQRREIIKRIVEFEAFSNCWESDQFKAKGLVSEIQKIVNIKDSFTRMKEEKDKKRQEGAKEYQEKLDQLNKIKEEKEEVKKELYSLFGEASAQKRGKLLEKVLNSYFRLYGILIKEDFKRYGDHGEGILEQIDGIIELEGRIFLVEMKWTKDRIGSQEIYAHLGRIYHRANAHGIYISSASYTSSGIEAAKEALIKGALIVLIDLQELTEIINSETDFFACLKNKIQAAIIEKNPHKKI